MYAQLLICLQIYATAWDAHQASLSMRSSRQECWNGLPFHRPGDLPDSAIKRTSLASPVVTGGFFTTAT